MIHELTLQAMPFPIFRLDWTGLDWTGLDWTGPDWTGLDWTGLGRLKFYVTPSRVRDTRCKEVEEIFTKSQSNARRVGNDVLTPEFYPGLVRSFASATGEK